MAFAYFSPNLLCCLQYFLVNTTFSSRSLKHLYDNVYFFVFLKNEAKRGKLPHWCY